MKLCRVRGNVVATISHPTFAGRTLLLCQPLDFGLKPKGEQVIAVDHAQAGEGDLVLVLTEGNGVRQILGPNAGPIRSIVVGIVDQVSVS